MFFSKKLLICADVSNFAPKQYRSYYGLAH